MGHITRVEEIKKVEEISKVAGTSKKAIILAILCTLFTSLGQLSWKWGVVRIDLAHWQTFFNLFFLLGFVFYGFGFLLLVRALKDGELTVVFPIVATSYVWVSVISPLLFPEDHMNMLKWMGVGIILISVILLSKNAKKEKQTEKKIIDAPVREVQHA